MRRIAIYEGMRQGRNSPKRLVAYAKVDDEDFEWLSVLEWKPQRSAHGLKFYAVTLMDKKYQFMHRLILNTPEGKETDHINRNTLDNRRSNLRVVTASENRANQLSVINSKSGNVGIHRERNKWRVRVRWNGHLLHLGYFNNLDEAVRVRVRATS